MRGLFILPLLFAALFSYAQNETLNQFDAAGKKDGKWIVYLDSRWNKTDSANAVFYRYTWFDHGVNIHPMGPGGGKNSRMETSTDTSAQPGRIKLLDGEYKWYDAKGRLRFVHVLKKGEYVSYKELYPEGAVQTFFDYTKKCEDQPHSWATLIYDKQGNLTHTSYTCKVNGKWPLMRD